MTAVQRRLHEVRYRVAAACARSRRDPASVRLVAVSKTMPVELVREALAAGQMLFGENRVQEALPKIEAAGPGARWHLIGHLQKNKARHAAGAFELIHSVDDAALAVELDRRAAMKGIVQPVLVQANLAAEETKHGAGESALLPLIAAVAELRNLDLRGLMIIPPPVDDPALSRPWFKRLHDLRDLAADRLGRSLPELSMGMTDDFEVAIEEGSTLVRVGRAIFGERGVEN
jgi:pyridoxal phosphate enzyme (YggS family)